MRVSGKGDVAATAPVTTPAAPAPKKEMAAATTPKVEHAAAPVSPKPTPVKPAPATVAKTAPAATAKPVAADGPASIRNIAVSHGKAEWKLRSMA